MNTQKSVFVRNVALAACLAIPAFATVAHAQDEDQDSVAMAPPVQATESADGNSAADAQSVFNWRDVPANQNIKITRAVFDQGGYQLYAATGETIVVPFVDNNLYAMKFGQTGGGEMYFVNDGSAPTLYMPQGGYLENAAASGAKWYPFSKDFTYTEPVYVGIAPTWDAYLDMGWYPGMSCYGGYWGYNPWAFGVSFGCMPGFYFNIFGSPYYGWGGYHNFYYGHAYNRFGWNNAPRFGHYGVGPHGPGGFGHYNGSAFGRSGAFGRPGNGFGRNSGGFGRTPYSGVSGRAESGNSGFRGGASNGSGNRRPFSPQPGGNSGSYGGSHTFGGGSSAGRTFSPQSGGGNYGRTPFSSGGRTFSPQGNVGNSSRTPFSSGGRTFSPQSGGAPFSGNRTFGGGGSAPFSGNRSFGGGGSTFSGGRSFGGGMPSGGASFGGSRSVGGGSFGGGGGVRMGGGGGSFGGGRGR